MISVNGDPRGVCRGKRGVRKREEDGAERRRRKREKSEEKNNQEQCTGMTGGQNRCSTEQKTEIRQQMVEIVLGGVTTLGKKYSKLVRMVGRRCCKVGRRRRVQDAEGE